MAGIATFLVDAFTAGPFSGNPAAVCLLDADLPAGTHQRVAAELNQPVTAFVTRTASPAAFGVRWFTPTTELDLCGHGTLASAAVLLAQASGHGSTLRFQSASGELVAVQELEGIRLDLKSAMTTAMQAPTEILAAIGVKSQVAVAHSAKLRKLLIELGSVDAVRALAPDFPSLLRAKNDLGITGVIVTSRGDATCDFVSRYFAPWVGIDEDAATGSAHTILGPYWGAKLGKTELKARQDSRRGGHMRIRLAGDRVHLIAQARIVFEGRLHF